MANSRTAQLGKKTVFVDGRKEATLKAELGLSNLVVRLRDNTSLKSSGCGLGISTLATQPERGCWPATVGRQERKTVAAEGLELEGPTSEV